MKACIVTIALLACAAQDAVPALDFKDTDGTTCRIKKDGSDIVGACGSDAFKSIISGDTVVQDQRISALEANVNSLLHNTPCRPGYHKTAISPFESEADAHTAVCVSCVGHTFNDEITYETACTPCATGYAHRIGHDHTSCDVCATGYGEVSSAETCDVCEADFFSTNENAQAVVPCSSCSDNTHTNNQVGQTACTMCNAGWGLSGYDAYGHANCVECVPGQTYSTKSMVSCNDLPTCVAGTGVISGHSFSTTSTGDYCVDCSDNTVYSNENSLSSCKTHEACPAGQGVSNFGDVSDISHRTCSICDNTHYSANDAFAECYLIGSKYSKTTSDTAPLECATSYYSTGTITYEPSTGAVSTPEVCESCPTCSSSPIETACGATSPTVCCTKPSNSYFTASNGAVDASCNWSCNSGFTQDCGSCTQQTLTESGNACAFPFREESCSWSWRRGTTCTYSTWYNGPTCAPSGWLSQPNGWCATSTYSDGTERTWEYCQ